MSGYIGQGTKVDEFETLLRGYFGSQFLNTTNSATSALHLAIHLYKDLPGNEVLTTPLTCTATNFAILANGLKLKWVDIDPATCNLDMDDLERKISANTKMIMVVHWGGYACDLDRLKAIQDKCEKLYGHKPPIIEDAAHAFGATYKNKPIGSHGNTVAFSFQAIKHLTTGDGGCLITPTEELHNRARLLRWYGLDRTSQVDFRCQQNIQEWGFKFHMNDIAATIGLNNFETAKNAVLKHRQNAEYYNEQFRDKRGIILLENKPDRETSSWIYTMRVENKKSFIARLASAGVTTSVVHDRNDKHKCVEQFRCILPNMDRLMPQMICIPSGWWLTEEDRAYIAKVVIESA
jgi:dTDP-4-amino-4,6-dideoxygalactose transaminase